MGLHALKSARSILAFRERYPERPIVLVLTGTDLYRDIRRSALALRAMEAADRLVTLQPAGICELPRPLRSKAVAVIQSAPAARRTRKHQGFTVCVLGHLRFEKDPMRVAYALRCIDPEVEMRVVQAGQILTPRYEMMVRREMEMNPRYRYVGALNRRDALRLLANSDLLVQSSRMEGGANAVSEAIACGVPVIASRISGNIGMLGASYPGYYRAGDTNALTKLLVRAMRSSAFYETLRRSTEMVKPLVTEKRERDAWCNIL